MFVIKTFHPTCCKHYRLSLQILKNNSRCYVTKNGKKLSRQKYLNVTSMKIDVIEKY